MKANWKFFAAGILLMLPTMKRVHFLLVIMLCLIAISTKAQSLVAEAPQQVFIDEPFRLTYKVDTQDAIDFQIGKLPAAFEIIYGPSTSSGSSFSSINGVEKSEYFQIYTYTLQPLKSGTYTIPAATVIADGKYVTSNVISIKVLGPKIQQLSEADAQTLKYVKSLIAQGSYLDAAKRLRPLADGGIAEAQAVAARLFFEGKGVTKNDAQGVKYATMAADKGNEDAILLLYDHYCNTSNPAKAFGVLKTYTDKYPYLKRGKVGMSLSRCYRTGYSTEKDEALGWKIAEKNKGFSQLKSDKRLYDEYLRFKAKEAGKDCLEDYADYLFDVGDGWVDFKTVCDHIASMHNNIKAYYERRANEGNAFACAMLADMLYDNGEISKARQYNRKSIQGGSAYGRTLQEKMDFTPQSFTINAKFDNRVTFVEIEHRYDKTILHGIFKGQGSSSWKEFDQEAYMTCNGSEEKYPIAKKNNRVYGRSDSQPVRFILEFAPIPADWHRLDFCHNGRSYLTIYE